MNGILAQLLLFATICCLTKRKPSIDDILSYDFFVEMRDSLAKGDIKSLAFLQQIALIRSQNKELSHEIKEIYAKFLKDMGSDPIPVHMDVIYQHLIKYVRACGYVREEYDPQDRRDIRDEVIFTFVLTHWSEFFEKIFNADTPLCELWRINECIFSFIERYETLYKAHPGIFLYMRDVMKERLVKCDAKEKQSAQLLLENIEFIYERVNFDPYLPEEEEEEEEF
jgi:uncharacterized protein (UPF0335 family)